MYEIRKHKIELRRKYLARRAALTSEMRAVMDERICRNILASAAYRYADILLLFYPVKGEVDVLPVARAARAAGKRVAFPKCRPEDHSMTFHFADSEEDLEDGIYISGNRKRSFPYSTPRIRFPAMSFASCPPWCMTSEGIGSDMAEAIMTGISASSSRRPSASLMRNLF